MLDTNMKAQLQGYLERLTRPIEILASVDHSDSSREMLDLLADIAAASPLVHTGAGITNLTVHPEAMSLTTFARPPGFWATSSPRGRVERERPPAPSSRPAAARRRLC